MSPKESTQFAPPWREVRPSGELGDPYGPSPTTFARHLAEWKNWAFDKQRLPSKDARGDRDELLAYLEREPNVPERQRQVFAEVYLRGRSVRWVAREFGMSRSTVRVHLRRLREKAKR